LFAFLVSLLAVQAQDLCKVTWKGEVVDALSGEGLPYALLSSKVSDRVAVTDQEGKFTLSQVCEEDTAWEIRYVGYQTRVITLAINPNPVKIALEKASFLLQEVQIVGEKPAPIVGAATETLVGDLWLMAPGVSFGEKLQSLNGVTTLQTGPTIFKPVIHGLHSNRIVILNNGIRLEGQQWGLEHAPEIDPSAIHRVTVVKGAGTVRYGSDAIGGVIVVEPDRLPQEGGLAGHVSLLGHTNGRGAASSLILKGGITPWKGAGWRLQGSWRQAGDAHSPNYLLTNTGVRELNFSGALGIDRQRWGGELSVSHFSTELGIMASAHIGNLTDLQDAFARERPFVVKPFSHSIDRPRQQVSHTLVKGNVFAQLNPQTRLTALLGSQWNQRQEFDRRRGARAEIPALDMLLHSHSGEVVITTQLNQRWNSTAGLNGMYQVNTNIPGTGVIPLVPNYNMGTAGLFAFTTYTHEKITFEAGMRYDYRHLRVLRFNRQRELERPDFHFQNLAINLGMVWEPSTHFTYRSNIGTAWRPPHVQELFSQGLHHGVAALEIGNDALLTERAIKWVHHVDYQKGKWHVQLSPYWNLIRNYIFLEPQEEPALTIRGAFPVFHFTQTDARLLGVDFTAQYNFSSVWQYTVKFSTVHARDLQLGDHLIFMPPDQWAQTLTLSLPDGLRRSGTFLRVQHLQVSRQNRAPEGVDFAPPPAGYGLVGVQAGARWALKKGHMLLVQTGADNLLNKAYRDYMNRFRYFADDTGRNIFASVSYEFGK
jgi:iron complex outermembrane receptor protein